MPWELIVWGAAAGLGFILFGFSVALIVSITATAITTQKIRLLQAQYRLQNTPRVGSSEHH